MALLDLLGERPELPLAVLAQRLALPDRRIPQLVALAEAVVNQDGQRILRYERTAKIVVLDLELLRQCFELPDRL